MAEPDNDVGAHTWRQRCHQGVKKRDVIRVLADSMALPQLHPRSSTHKGALSVREYTDEAFFDSQLEVGDIGKAAIGPMRTVKRDGHYTRPRRGRHVHGRMAPLAVRRFKIHAIGTGVFPSDTRVLKIRQAGHARGGGEERNPRSPRGGGARLSHGRAPRVASRVGTRRLRLRTLDMRAAAARTRYMATLRRTKAPRRHRVLAV